ncbi:MarR family winged helix-turn-helix transcriptional regulator [Agromyces sp. NPDC056965]|uniref:MarR family winged helix-turn-helix transcriptional regulator n=1 Tax=Agromyces sp. NPDC056965 TaxID=3345983 RepID=UPI00363BF648
MSADPIDAIEYEAMVLARHLTELPGRSRRTGGTLDQSAYILLNILRAGGPASIGELSRITGLDASTLNRQTAALLRDGYVERISDPAGGIARRFRPTDHGDTALDDERAASRTALASIIADWSPSDRAAFASYLEQFNRAIETRTRREWPRAN